MTIRRLTAVALAALLLTAGVGAATALPGQAATAGNDHANDHANDASAGHGPDGDHGAPADPGGASAANATTSNASAANAAANASAASHVRGPPVEMPEPVPDHVAAIHKKIRQFLADQLTDLGAAVSGVARGDHPTRDHDDQPSDDEQATTTTTEANG